MGFQIRYEPLFEIDVQHAFYLNGRLDDDDVRFEERIEFDQLDEEEQKRKLAKFDLFDDLELVVLEETERTLAGLGCLVKQTKTGFVVATEVEELGDSFRPARNPDRPYQLRFVLESHEPSFWNFTNSVDGHGRPVYYLSNRAGQSDGESPDLALPPQSFDSDESYSAGSVVGDEGKAYLALRSSRGATPSANDPWHELGDRHYVTDEDRVSLRGTKFRINPPTQSATITAVHLVDQDGESHEVEFDPGSAGQAVFVDAGALALGRYELVVTTTGSPSPQTQVIYIDDALPARNVVAVIEMFHLQNDDPLGDFRLYGESPEFLLKQPTFKVRLLNRHSFWRYRFRQEPVVSDVGDLEQVSEKVFVTSRARALTESVQRVLFNDKPLPNPSAQQVIPEEIPDESRVFFSDVYVHNTNP